MYILCDTFHCILNVLYICYWHGIAFSISFYIFVVNQYSALRRISKIITSELECQEYFVHNITACCDHAIHHECLKCLELYCYSLHFLPFVYVYLCMGVPHITPQCTFLMVQWLLFWEPHWLVSWHTFRPNQLTQFIDQFPCGSVASVSLLISTWVCQEFHS